jgi:hypothetical protein
MAAATLSDAPVFMHRPPCGGLDAVVPIRGSFSRIAITGTLDERLPFFFSSSLFLERDEPGFCYFLRFGIY